MNDIVNKFLLVGDAWNAFKTTWMLVDHLLKTKKEFKSLKKQEIQDIFTKIN